jgi:transposase-like protein
VFFDFPVEIRKIIYNVIKNLMEKIRSTPNKLSFPTDDAVFKISIFEFERANQKWSMPIQTGD